MRTVVASWVGEGLGRAMIVWAIEEARRSGLVKLTPDKRRADAIRFYEALGPHSPTKGLILSL